MDRLSKDGALVLPDFLSHDAVSTIRQEGAACREMAYFCRQEHTAYLSPPDPDLPSDHTRNRLVASSKGCITDDLIPQNSPLRGLYNDPRFCRFMCSVLGLKSVHPYADPLSSINLHYAETGQELGWHFDNSSFAITLMVQPAIAGGHFEYVENVRNADAGEMNYQSVGKVLDGETPAKRLAMQAGTLVLFRGRNSLHRVTPVEGETTRMLAVLAYNQEPGVCLAEAARMTFYGRVR